MFHATLELTLLGRDVRTQLHYEGAIGLVPGGNKAEMDKLDGLENVTTHNPDTTIPLKAVSKKTTIA
jgi:hypothetical protein